MEMSEWVGMWKAIAEGRRVKIPFQLQCKYQLNDMIDKVFLSRDAAYKYFQAVLDAEPPTIEEEAKMTTEKQKFIEWLMSFASGSHFSAYYDISTGKRVEKYIAEYEIPQEDWQKFKEGK